MEWVVVAIYFVTGIWFSISAYRHHKVLFKVKNEIINGKLLLIENNLEASKKIFKRLQFLKDEFFNEKINYPLIQLYTSICILDGIMAFICVLELIPLNGAELTPLHKSLLIIIGSITLSLGLFLFYRNSKIYKHLDENVENEIEELNDEFNLSKIYDDVKRTEKQLKMSEKKLGRYYDLNLSHLKWVFYLGIIIIAVGMLLIIGVLIYTFAFAEDVNFIVTILGCISGVLINFLGAIFIHMYTQTVKASTEFHNKLAYTNQLMFANSLIAKIKDDENLKNETIAEISKIIAQREIGGSSK